MSTDPPITAEELFPKNYRDPFHDSRPKVRLPGVGDSLLLSDAAMELSYHLRDKDLYIRNGELVMLKDDHLEAVETQTFRTLVERHVVCYRERTSKQANQYQTFEVNVTMTNDEATGLLASEQFRDGIRLVKRLNHCRQPVRRADGTIELLPEGYDEASQTLTVGNVSYAEDMAIDDAVEVLENLFSEFIFADGPRSKAVAVAAMVGIYCAQLLPEGALRPCFIVTKNAEGAGATTLIRADVVPILGRLPTGVTPKDDDEMRKTLTTAVAEGSQTVFLDNLKGHLSSSPLEAFLTAPWWKDRGMRKHKSIEGPNLATVFISGNGCTWSPDMGRRSLVIELRLEAERPEERTFRQQLNQDDLLKMRARILTALWAFLRHWLEKGQPEPSRSNSSFGEWSQIAGGIVQAAGFECPLDRAEGAARADQDLEDMRTLVTAMEFEREYNFVEICALCLGRECFPRIVTSAEITPKARSRLGIVLARYDHRIVNDRRFVIEKGRKAKYTVHYPAEVA
jgi:hypothetical protein